MSVCFISDAHLGVRSPGWQQREARLVRFLHALDPAFTRLVIVGDLFDFWIEYRNLIRSEYFTVLRTLCELRERGVELHYVAGNHDFALGPFLTRQVGMCVYPDAMDARMEGVQVHVQHGDGVLPSDVLYRMLRAMLRSRLNQRLYKMMHPTLGIGFAALASRLSRHGSSGRPLKQPRIEAYRQAARGMVARHRADIVVLGHTHTAEICRGPEGVYCNTGEWIRAASYATLEGGQIRLWQLDADDSPVECQPIDW